MNDNSTFSTFADRTRPSIKEEIQRVINQSGAHGCVGLKEMITFQLGWTGENAGSKAEGKQIRPLLVLLAAEAAGGEWRSVLPAAAAVELIHNFSLIHDDIEDRGDTRRGRPSLWKLWGEAQAINTGDAMFALANLSILNLENSCSNEFSLQASSLFNSTCLRLTQGQHLDIRFEDLDQISLEDYWLMVGGKTAALLAFCLEVGALSAEVSPEIQSNYRDFGHYLGLAFQVQDDILGIWGEKDEIGKSTIGDLIERKKTLPVLFGLDQKKEFYERWSEGPISPDDALVMSQVLEAEGGLAYAQTEANRLTDQALTALKNAQPKGESGIALMELAAKLLNRTN